LFAPLPDLAKRAEEAGFDRVWTTEFPDRDALIRATVIALATSRIGVASGIAYSFSRHPLALAAAALDVHEASGGRFTLGLGTATAAMRTRWFGLDQDRPIARLADAVALMRASWVSTDRFKHSGPYFQGRVEGLNQAVRTAGLGPLAIYGSGLNAAMLRGAAACCDGLAIHPLATGPLFAERIIAPILADARRLRAQPDSVDEREGFPAAMWVITQIDQHPERARERARRALAFFFSTPGYETAAEGERWADAPERIRRRFAESRADWDAVSAEVPDEMIDAMALCGAPADVQAQLPALEARLQDVGIDEIVFQTGVDLGETEFVLNCRNIIDCCARTPID
jgi:alkanesulfonate monooxygenase SsuD/methylene tetrahydromethanopterin reductase-like flavin-dependent oxidoreductase (luciferase family)